MKKILLLAVIALLGWAGHAAWRYFSPAAPSGPEFRVAKVERGEVVQTVTASGQLSAVETVEVGSQVSGNVHKIHVDFNDAVKAGQVVAEIDPATFEARVVQAEGELLNAEAGLELARINARRATLLCDKQLIAQSELDATQAELKQKEATVKIKEAILMNARVDLERTQIRSPTDGIVILRNVEVGQTVQASFTAPKLFEVAKDLREMEISADVSEADIGQVAEGQDATFVVDAYPDITFEGKVQQVRNNPTTVQNVVTFATIIGVKNPDLKLKPGMTANVTIITARREGVLKVPNAALRFRPPEGVLVEGVSSGAGTTNAAAAAAEAAGGSGRGEFGSMPEDVRQRMLARYDKNKDGQLDDGERTAMREGFRSRSGGSGKRAADGVARPPRESSSASKSRTVYLPEEAKVSGDRGSGALRAVPLDIGISDGAFTEVASGIDDGVHVVIGTVIIESAKQPATTNPFAPPMRPPGGRR